MPKQWDRGKNNLGSFFLLPSCLLPDFCPSNSAWSQWHESLWNKAREQSGGRARSGSGGSRPRTCSFALPFANTLAQVLVTLHMVNWDNIPLSFPFRKPIHSLSCILPHDSVSVKPIANSYGWTQIPPLFWKLFDRFHHWPVNLSVPLSWQVNLNLEMDMSGLMTLVIKVIQLPPSAPSPCSPSKLWLWFTSLCHYKAAFSRWLKHSGPLDSYIS